MGIDIAVAIAVAIGCGTRLRPIATAIATPIPIVIPTVRALSFCFRSSFSCARGAPNDARKRRAHVGAGFQTALRPVGVFDPGPRPTAGAHVFSEQRGRGSLRLYRGQTSRRMRDKNSEIRWPVPQVRLVFAGDFGVRWRECAPSADDRSHRCPGRALIHSRLSSACDSSRHRLRRSRRQADPPSR